MITRMTVVALAVGLWAVLPLSAAHPAAPAFTPSTDDAQTRTIFKELNWQEALEITIETDLVHLIDNRRTVDYQAGSISFQNQVGEQVSLSLKLRPRGKYRRRICDFPPVMLNFSKKELNARGLAGQFDKLKLVTHCLDDKFESKENILREYLAYKVYNEITPHSYRVQLVVVNYIDSKGKLGDIKRYGILLEDTDEMAQRLGGTECEECLNSQENVILREEENNMAMFQYLIGNADWNLSMNRNVKVVKLQQSGKLLSVPYDFDFAGIVDADYAVPNVDYNLINVQDRVYLGRPAGDDALWRSIRHLREKRSAIRTMIENFDLIGRGSRNRIIKYLDSFYRLVEKLEATGVKGLYQMLHQSASTMLAEPASEAAGFERAIGK